MNSLEAKQILIAYRAGHTDASDPEVAEALRLAHRDPFLRQWLEQQRAFHGAMEAGLREIPVPGDLKNRILSRAKTIQAPVWRRSTVWAAAAVFVLLLGLAAMLLLKPATDGSFETFRSRMVRNVMRQYKMDIETNNMPVIRQFLATNNAPSDYILPPGLAQLPTTGAGILSWQDQRVSMVCFDGGKQQGTLFLFVVDRSAVTRPPPGDPAESAQVSRFMTVSWTQAEKVCVLAGIGSKETLLRYR